MRVARGGSGAACRAPETKLADWVLASSVCAYMYISFESELLPTRWLGEKHSFYVPE
jgi:hypothetical protein